MTDPKSQLERMIERSRLMIEAARQVGREALSSELPPGPAPAEAATPPEEAAPAAPSPAPES